MSEIENVRQRKNALHKWINISSKTGENVTVTLTPQERAFLFATSSFASEHPHFLVEYSEEHKDALDAFLSGIVAKLA